jgi:DNA-binding transcriptional LysR family regulator
MPRILMERSGEMEVFARVVEKGGFSAAARSLDLTPSAVSKLIGRLEQRLGARLLARTTRAFTLTEEGASYHRAAVRVFAGAERGRPRGRNRNGARPHPDQCIAAVRDDVRSHIDRGLRRALSQSDGRSQLHEVVNLLEEKADVAIRVGNLPDSALKARKLAQSRHVVCASPDYLKRRGTLQTPADLAHHNCLTFNFSRWRSRWPFRHKRRDFEQPVSGNVQVNNGETMRQIVLEGAGIARLGRWHVAGAIKSGAIVPLLEEFNPGDLELIHAVYLGGGNLPGSVRAFIDYMIETLAKTDVFERAK